MHAKSKCPAGRLHPCHIYIRSSTHIYLCKKIMRNKESTLIVNSWNLKTSQNKHYGYIHTALVSMDKYRCTFINRKRYFSTT